ncbi:hypothetical protein NPIL_559341 [Nephila pilipes]|uniref:Uncharacterized protein n=1 Tax=Nephila pilipes TaxID=299642 RepID=A0A8X6QB25_NEPPI|nr:hypothetical protein NPIL_559341 [Nephila pilipes]
MELLKSHISPDLEESIQLKNEILESKEQKHERNAFPIVKSFIVYKICLALDLKVQFKRGEKECHFIAKQKNHTNEKSAVPSITTLKIGKPSSLDAQLSPSLERNYVLEKYKMETKSPPTVRSIMVYCICQALDIKVKLNMELEFDWKNNNPAKMNSNHTKSYHFKTSLIPLI